MPSTKTSQQFPARVWWHLLSHTGQQLFFCITPYIVKQLYSVDVTDTRMSHFMN